MSLFLFFGEGKVYIWFNMCVICTLEVTGLSSSPAAKSKTCPQSYCVNPFWSLSQPQQHLGVAFSFILIQCNEQFSLLWRYASLDIHFFTKSSPNHAQMNKNSNGLTSNPPPGCSNCFKCIILIKEYGNYNIKGMSLFSKHVPAISCFSDLGANQIA